MNENKKDPAINEFLELLGMNKKSNIAEIDGFKKVCEEMIALKIRKAGVYGQTWRIFGLNGTYAEIGRKFSRIWINKSKQTSEIDFETLRDSLIDLAVYSIMSIQLIDENDIEDKIYKILTE